MVLSDSHRSTGGNLEAPRNGSCGLGNFDKAIGQTMMVALLTST